MDPDFFPEETNIPIRLLEATARAPWNSLSELKVVMALLRMTRGCDLPEASISLKGWRALTGMSDRTVQRAKAALHRAGVLILLRNADPREQLPQRWALQEDPRKWGRFSPRPWGQ